MRQVKKLSGPDGIFSFNVSHKSENISPAPFDAGYDRGTRSMYMDISKVPPNEWLVKLCHELLHSIDERVYQAVEDFADPDTLDEVIRINKNKTDIAQLNPQEHKFLMTWLGEGLNKGILAEYRAWALTDLIYRQGLSEGLWKPIAWIDRIFLGCANNNERRLRILQELLAQKIDPDFTELGAMDWPMNRQLYKVLMEHLGVLKTAPPLAGILGLLAAE
jgi:hypothetical protein